MDKRLTFTFKTDISKMKISAELNNPFGSDIPEIAQLAAQEFQQLIISESQGLEQDFLREKGKMFGVLVVQNEEGIYGYLVAVSGKLPTNMANDQFIPSVFVASTEDSFIYKGMNELSEMSREINEMDEQSEIIELMEQRKKKSIALQQKLFENYRFLNQLGVEKNVLQIFKCSSHGNPPVAAGECAAPKLLHYAFKNQLKPIALAEFWWGNSSENKEKKHRAFYPACKNRCRPILEYMLDDKELFNQANLDLYNK